MAPYAKPIPVPSLESRPFWQGLREHKLLLLRCSDCGHTWFPPTVTCPLCRSLSIKWEMASGQGRIFSFVNFHRSYHPGFSDEIPYCVALIELQEGPRMLGRISGLPFDRIRCGQDVCILFDDISNELTLPVFHVTNFEAV
ncbi:MAG: hypothetical protein JWM36_542 [Hyphomicrobiales bacterium]|nr:hypothetical protein [Hyphomicrobiales bacterium]